MMPNLKEVKKPRTLMELFRMDHNVQYLIKGDRGDWKVMKIKMDFRNSRFGLLINGDYNIKELTMDSHIDSYITEIYEIDELFDMIKEGR